MPDLAYIQRSLYAAWRLARLDPSGMQWFDIGIDGFFRSFFAAVLAAPLYAVLVALHRPEAVEPSRLLLAESVAYVVGWIAFPLLMIPLSRSLGLDRNYVPYIVAYNWAQALAMVFWLPVSGLLLAAGSGIGAFLGMLAFGAVLYYFWFVTRAALGAGPMVAAGLVLVEYMSGLLIHSLAARLF